LQAFDLVRTVQGVERTQYSAAVDYSDCNAHAPLFVRIVRILGDRKYGRTIRQDRASGEGSGLPSISPRALAVLASMGSSTSSRVPCRLIAITPNVAAPHRVWTRLGLDSKDQVGSAPDLEGTMAEQTICLRDDLLVRLTLD
jgi:hypothetical protein